jgi:predicted DNA-binding transcriptional regulator AlpA
MEFPTADKAKLGCGPRSRRKPMYVPDDPLLTAAEAAAERGQARSTFWRDVRAGRVPPAYYVTPRCPRWRRSELRDALETCRAQPKGAV